MEITDLDELITNMKPVLNGGEYIFASVANTAPIPRAMTVSEIKEKEGITVVLSKKRRRTTRILDKKN